MASIQQLLGIMRTLRDPNTGCPWDLKQTFKTIAPYTLEEAYEVTDAIERGDHEQLQDELGDLLLQVVFHSQIAHELDLFAFEDVVQSICDKMERRHPHIFGETKNMSVSEVRASWQQIKQQERGKNTSVLQGIARSLPALKKAQKLGSRAASIGFDWPHVSGALSKIEEEIAELHEAIAAKDADNLEAELGDVLFSVVNVCRHYGVDAEQALERTNQKFVGRFEHVEAAKREAESAGAQIDLEFLEQHWQKAKNSISNK